MFASRTLALGLVLVVALGTASAVALAQETTASVVVEVEGPQLAPQLEVAPVDPAPMIESLPPAPIAHEHHFAAPVAAPVCYPIHVIREVKSHSARRAYRCHGAPVHQTLCVDNPADCCRKLFSVPVCVPACCVGEPVCVNRRTGLLGRGYVTYRWSCGFEATVVFRVKGGVIIQYR